MSATEAAKTIFQTVDKERTKTQKTLDGYRNFAAKLGVAPIGQQVGSDNLLSKGTYNFNLITRNRVLLEAAYRGSWIVGRVVDCVAEDMTRAGIEINTNEGADDIQDFKVQMSRLQIWSSTMDAIKWGRLYGGCIGVLQIDGQDLETPLDTETVDKGQFLGIVTYDRWQVYPVLSKLINSGPNMGLPAYYDIVLGANLNDPGQEPDGSHTDRANGRVRVHHSRCFRTGGHKLPFYQAITEMMWEESILERLWDRLIEFDTATAAAGGLITRANLRTVSIDGYREILAAGGEAEAALIKQFEYMREFQSSEGLTLLDKLDEFDSTAYSFAGLSDMLNQFGEQLSGSAEIPLVRLFGQTPTGLNTDGSSDIRNYYDSINAKQESTLRNPMELIIKVLWQSTFGRPKPKDLSFTFTPLWQMSALDKATIAKSNTDTIIEAHQEGLVNTQTAMKELKQSSGDNGVFTNITDEQIKEAENEEPPLPEELGPASQTTGDPAEGPATPETTKEDQKQPPKSKPTGDSAFGSRWWNAFGWMFPHPPLVPTKDIPTRDAAPPVVSKKPANVRSADQDVIAAWLAK